jgi:2-amino-4-hydroxy-6-hydroxymethyldihydropteridine diphosphokinase
VCGSSVTEGLRDVAERDEGELAKPSRLRAHLGLGSNLGERWSHLARAVASLRLLGEEVVVSPVYESAPVGGPPGQGPYLNAVVRLWLEGGPLEVLELAQRLEAAAGRTREVRWGPRTLDVDVLLLEAPIEGDRSRLVLVRVESPELVVPHPRLFERAFVLAPLEDVSPELVDARWRERLGGDAAVSAAVRRVGEIVVGAR